MSTMKILVVEDDVEMGRLLERGLASEGYEPEVVTNGVDALIAVRQSAFAAAAIDVMLPGMSGFELCRRLREANDPMPILLLTARDAVEDRVHGLDSGADDYLTKPFAFAELAARIRALLRREPTGVRVRVTVGRLAIDSHEHRALVSGREVSLSRREFTLLRLLATNPDTTLSRAEILEEVWGSPDHIGPNVIDQYISYLRKKLDAADAGIQIITERGRGYRLDGRNAKGLTP
ncbi:MAG TPA: response regulator transcription factor [Microbacteriaceae bacterium]|jgi:two-component system OmpR family response regulator|nr:response regulator transcription factor [Microbacteriaceae bacterium]